jgi:hypothetical protein
MRRTRRRALTASGALILAGLVATNAAGSASRPRLASASPDQALQGALGPNAALIEHDLAPAADDKPGLVVETWKYRTAESTVDLVLVSDQGGKNIGPLISDRALGQDHRTIALGQTSATVERTADEYGPGLIIITWQYDPDTAAHLIAHDSLDEARVIELATTVEAQA